MMPLPTALIDGRQVPLLAFGVGTTWSKRGDPVPNRALIDRIKTAISRGLTHIDCASKYNTEAEVGIAIKESGVSRSSLFITTKASYELYDLEKSLRESLQRLSLDYVDLFLIHSPFLYKSMEDIAKAWQKMENIKALGLASSIGVSNFLPEHLAAIIDSPSTKTVPSVNQIEIHPYLQRTATREYMKRYGILAAGYSPLLPLRKVLDGPIDAAVQELAQKYDVTTAAILLRYLIDQDIIAVTTCSSEARMEEYLKVTTFGLTSEEIQRLSEIGAKLHFRGRYNHHIAEGNTS